MLEGGGETQLRGGGGGGESQGSPLQTLKAIVVRIVQG